MKNEKGFSLIEVILAIALMGIIAVGVCYALATASKVLIVADERATAESLARTQMEYIKTQPYSDGEWSYEVTSSNPTVLDGEPSWWQTSPPPPPTDAGYSVEACAENFDSREGIRKITVVVYHEHPEKTEIVKLEAYKGDR